MIIPNQPEADYHAHPAISKSGLWKIYTETPFHFRNRAVTPSKAMDLGSAVHMALLEPERFESCCFRGPDDRRGNKWKDAQQYCEAYGHLLVTGPDYDKALYMRDAALQLPVIKQMTSGGQMVEHSAYWIDPETQVECRSRVDLYNPIMKLGADLKTTNDASRDTWSRNAASFGYHVQEAMYSEGWQLAGGGDMEAFVFILIESEFPHPTVVYEFIPEAIAEGREVMRKALLKYKECEESGMWPGYPREIQQLDIPRWAYKETLTN